MKKDFFKTYLNIISEMNQVQNISQNISFDKDLNDLFKGDGFPGEPGTSVGSGYSSYNPTFKVGETDLTDGKTCQFQVSDDTIYYSWDPGQNGGRTDPSWPAGVDDIGAIDHQFTKDLNDKDNDQYFKITLYSNDGTKQVKLSQLSLQDRYLIFKAYDKFLQDDDMFAQLDEQIIESSKYDYDDYYDRDDYYNSRF